MLKLQFLADMNISPLTVAKLKDLGWDIIRVSDVLDKKAKDLEILIYGQETDRVLITKADWQVGHLDWQLFQNCRGPQ